MIHSIPVFIGVTIIFMGGCAFMTGQAVSATWRPLWQVLAYSLMLVAQLGRLCAGHRRHRRHRRRVLAGDSGPTHVSAISLDLRTRRPVRLARAFVAPRLRGLSSPRPGAKVSANKLFCHQTEGYGR